MTDDTEQQVLAAAAALVTAFGSHEAGAYFDAFAPEASFIFYTTANRLESRAAYKSLWERWEWQNRFRVHSCVSTNRRVQVFDGVGIFSHDVETRLELDGVASTVHERETIVFAQRDGRWLAVHEHLSPKP